MSAEQDPSNVLYLVADVRVPAERQRKEAKADTALLTSIEQNGLINPILIHSDGTLVAGERRLDAHRQLGKAYIRATVLELLSPLIAFKLELAENLARKQLSWQEETKAIGKYHGMRSTVVPGWTQMGTANDLGISNATVSRSLLIAAALESGDTDVASCPTFTGALNLLDARAQRARIAAQSRGLDIAGTTALNIPPAIPEGATREERTRLLIESINLNEQVAETLDELDTQIANIEQGRIAEAALKIALAKEQNDDLILHADAIEWMASYDGPRFDVLHCDFPYGINYSGSRTRRTGKSHIAPIYNDSPDIYFTLVDALLEHQDRIAFPAAHCLFWFDMRFYAWTIEQFETAGWQLVQHHPLIWTKGYQGVASDVRRRPRHCYETALLFVRGDRKISNLDKDHFEAAVEEKLHINQKPLPMLKHFLNIICDEHTAVLDPTCGSGAALAAAAQLKVNRFLGIELDESNAQVARFLLQRRAPVKPTEKQND